MSTKSRTGRKDAVRKMDLKRAKLIGGLLPAMPINVVYQPRAVAVTMEPRGETKIFRFMQTQPEPKPHILGAWSLRDAFLALRSPGEAVEFFSATGLFQAPKETEVHASTDELSWDDITIWKGIIRALLQVKTGDFVQGLQFYGKSEEVSLSKQAVTDLIEKTREEDLQWIIGKPRGLEITAKPSKNENERPELQAIVRVESVLEAMLATIYVDGLQGIKRELCAFPDCKTLYEVTSNHARRYCSQACAHKASVRQRRKDEREARTSAST